MQGFDVAVIGGGVVGLSTAWKLAATGQSVVLLERHARFGEELSTRNSGVVHAGLYYRLDSLKGALCMEGNRRLHAFCRAANVPLRACGKLLVARCEQERADLLALKLRAQDLGAVEAELIGGARAIQLEPSLALPLAALWSPLTSVVDTGRLVSALAARAAAEGAELVPSARVNRARRQGAGWSLETSRGPVEAARVVNAAGLGAASVATLFGMPAPPLEPWRGDYFRLSAGTAWQRLIYPARAPASVGATSPGLGVHLTLEVGGPGVVLGPDAKSWPKASLASLGPPATPEPLRARFAAAAGRLLFDDSAKVGAHQLTWEGASLRPKRAPIQAADFHPVRTREGDWHLFGIESPGLTACLALAEMVAQDRDMVGESVSRA